MRVGIEATGPIHWFERLLEELGHELWIGDSAKIRASEVRKQKTDRARRCADSRSSARQPLSEDLGSLTGGTRPAATALAPSQAGAHAHHAGQPASLSGHEPGTLPEEKVVHQERPRGAGRLGSGTVVQPAASGALNLLDQLDPSIAELDRAVLEEAKRREDAVSLDDSSRHRSGQCTGVRAHHRSGDALSTEQAGGELPGTESERALRGGKQRLGAISKQGNTMVRWLLIEAAQPTVRLDPALRQDYQRLKFRRGHAVAKVAIARKLAVRMYWMLRSGADYAQLVRRQGSPGATLVNASPSLG